MGIAKSRPAPPSPPQPQRSRPRAASESPAYSHDSQSRQVTPPGRPESRAGHSPVTPPDQTDGAVATPAAPRERVPSRRTDELRWSASTFRASRRAQTMIGTRDPEILDRGPADVAEPSFTPIDSRGWWWGIPNTGSSKWPVNVRHEEVKREREKERAQKKLERGTSEGHNHAQASGPAISGSESLRDIAGKLGMPNGSEIISRSSSLVKKSRRQHKENRRATRAQRSPLEPDRPRVEVSPQSMTQPIETQTSRIDRCAAWIDQLSEPTPDISGTSEEENLEIPEEFIGHMTQAPEFQHFAPSSRRSGDESPLRRFSAGMIVSSGASSGSVSVQTAFRIAELNSQESLSANDVGLQDFQFFEDDDDDAKEDTGQADAFPQIETEEGYGPAAQTRPEPSSTAVEADSYKKPSGPMTRRTSSIRSRIRSLPSPKHRRRKVKSQQDQPAEGGPGPSSTARASVNYVEDIAPDQQSQWEEEARSSIAYSVWDESSTIGNSVNAIWDEWERGSVPHRAEEQGPMLAHLIESRVLCRQRRAQRWRRLLRRRDVSDNIAFSNAHITQRLLNGLGRREELSSGRRQGVVMVTGGAAAAQARQPSGSYPHYWNLLSPSNAGQSRILHRDHSPPRHPARLRRINTTQLPPLSPFGAALALDGADDKQYKKPNPWALLQSEPAERLLPSEDATWEVDGSAKAWRRPKRRIRPAEDQSDLFFPSGMPSSTGMPRAVPGTPGSQQQSTSVQPNGVGGGNPGAMAGHLTHAGHQMDINYLWGVVQELSDALAQNRAQTAGIIGSVQRMQTRASEDGGQQPSLQQANGEIHSNQAAQLANLQSRLHQTESQLESTQYEYQELSNLNAEYENVLNKVKDGVHEYAKAHSDSINSWHSHYNGIIQQERDANLQLRLEHGEWQAGLGRATEFARKALRASSEETAPLEGKIRGLKCENRVLRRLLRWEVETDSEDEEEERAKVGNVSGHGETGAALDGKGVSLS